MTNIGLENAIVFDADGGVKVMYIYDPVFPGELSLFINKAGKTTKVARLKELNYENGTLLDRKDNGGPFPEELLDDLRQLCKEARVKLNEINPNFSSIGTSTRSDSLSVTSRKKRKIRREIIHDLGVPEPPGDPFWKHFLGKMKTVGIPRNRQPKSFDDDSSVSNEVHPDDEPPKIDIFDTDCFESQVIKRQRLRIKIADRAFRTHYRKWKTSLEDIALSHDRLKRDLNKLKNRLGGNHVTATMRTMEHNMKGMQRNMTVLREPLREDFPPVDENDARPFPLYATDAIL